MFDTKKKGYGFKNPDNAIIFKQQLQNKAYYGATIRKGLPEYKGQVKTGYMVYHKARTIADELAISKIYNDIKVTEGE